MRTAGLGWVLVVATVWAGASVQASPSSELGVRFWPARQPGLVAFSIDGRPPAVIPPDEVKPFVGPTAVTRKLNKVPAWTWCYGCANTAYGMVIGYYDNGRYPYMYTGPVTHAGTLSAGALLTSAFTPGVAPMNNETAWPDSFNNPNYGESPLAATHIGYDGRTTRAHVENVWRGANNDDMDPWESNGWGEPGYTPCTGDYMWTSRHDKMNTDGSTTFYTSSVGLPASDYQGDEPYRRDGAHGMKLFVESRGYQLLRCFNQLIEQAPGFGNVLGYTWEDYKADINGGRPVLIIAGTHTFVGFGYNEETVSGKQTTGGNMYIRSTWDNAERVMRWGGSYGGQRHWAVSVIELASPPTESFPDVTVTPPGDPGPTGEDAYGDLGRQTVSRPCKPGETVSYVVRVQNDGNNPDTFRVRGTAGNTSFSVTYLGPPATADNLTSAITSAGGVQYTIPARGRVALTVKVTPKRGTADGTALNVMVSSQAVNRPIRTDTVSMITRSYRSGVDPTLTPRAPGLIATRATGSTQAQIRVLSSPDDPWAVVKYKVFRQALSPAGPLQEIGEIPATGAGEYTLNNTVLAEPKPYLFQVRAVNGALASDRVSTYLNNPAVTPGKAPVSARRRAEDTSTAVVTITASANDPNGVQEYILYRKSLAAAADYAEIARVPVGNRTRYTYQDSKLNRNSGYNYGVRAVNGALQSDMTTCKLLNAPVDPSITPRDPALVASRNTTIGLTRARLTITKSADDPAGCTHYKVYRQTIPPPSGWTEVGEVPATGMDEYVWWDEGLTATQHYRYTVQAHNGTKTSDPVIATLTNPNTTPRAPALGLSNYPGSAGHIVECTLYASPDDPGGCTGYRLYRQDVSPATAWVLIAIGNSDGSSDYGYEDGNRTPGKAYRYKLEAINNNRVSPAVIGEFTPAPTSGTALVATANAQGGRQGVTVTLNLTAAATVRVEVLNLAGRVVAQISGEQTLASGLTNLTWNGRGLTGTPVPAGSYLVRVTARTADGQQGQALAPLAMR